MQSFLLAKDLEMLADIFLKTSRPKQAPAQPSEYQGRKDRALECHRPPGQHKLL
jgi:hypothetical protein